RNGPANIYQQDARSPGDGQPLLKTSAQTPGGARERQAFPSDWSPNGRYILYAWPDPKNSSLDLWILPAGPEAVGVERKPEPYLQTPFLKNQAQFSPDGHWVAYGTDEPGTTQIYVQSFPAGNGKFQISTGG